RFQADARLGRFRSVALDDRLDQAVQIGSEVIGRACERDDHDGESQGKFLAHRPILPFPAPSALSTRQQAWAISLRMASQFGAKPVEFGTDISDGRKHGRGCRFTHGTARSAAVYFPRRMHDTLSESTSRLPGAAEGTVSTFCAARFRGGGDLT